MRPWGLFAASLLLLGLAGVLSGQVQTPIFTSMSPSATTAGVSSVTLNIGGGNFSNGISSVRWDQTTLPTNFVSSTQLTATVSAALLASPGTASVNVFNSNMGPTTPRTFTINSPPVITTASLAAMTVGVGFSQNLLASLGTPPYNNWRVVEGVLPAGLTLNASTGVISGTPTAAGSDFAQVSVNDSVGSSASQVLSWTVNRAVLTITTNSPLPGTTAGTSYSQTFAVAGGVSPYAWSSTGTLPPGLTLSAAGVLSGTPTQGGAFSFTVRVADRSESFTSKAFSLTVTLAALAITTNPSLPNGTAGLAYSQEFAATGGFPPYTWSVPPGALQPGLTLSAAGLLSGTPTQGGTSNFTVSVADVSGSIATRTFTLTVAVPQTTLTTTGLTDVMTPGQQPSFNVQLSEAYPLTITGTVTLTFHQNAIYPSDDPAIQFSTGGRSMNFTIPAGQISAFPTTLPSIQTGTVAGRIDLTLNYFAGGQNITPANQPVRAITIARSAPQINSVEVVKVAGGFNILVTGFSTPRQIIQADFTFTPAAGSELETTHATVIVDSVFTAWYTGTTSPLYGSLFLYTQPFTVKGNVSDIGSVSVTLAHATGTSTAVSASF